MNRKFSNYRCRATRSTDVREKCCDARYIQRDRLNNAVWGVISNLLQNPDIVMNELRLVQSAEPSVFSREIERLKGEIKRCERQERRAVRLFMMGQVGDTWVKGISGPLKIAREGYIQELRRLEAQESSSYDMDNLGALISESSQRVKAKLEGMGAGDQQMVLKAMQIKAIVTEDEVQVKGIIGVDDPSPDILTTERTWA